MDVTDVASLATAMSQQQTAQAVQYAVLKLAMNLQGQGAIQLVQAAAANNPPHLGNSVDVFA